jgi:hypothetical protein
MAAKKNDLTLVNPGFYMDGKGSMYLDMREFLTANGMPDTPAIRTVIWEEVHDIFGEVEVTEISDC